ncbi:MAG: DUF3224 domain-containing protein [Acidimicrobiales bacterium]
MTKARGSFEVTSWDEEPYEELEGGRKLTRASVRQAYTGDINGDASVQSLMSYREDGTAHFVGLQRINGTVADRSGSFVVESMGEFDGEVARGTWSVVAGSATGGLEGLHGTGSFEAPSGGEHSFELDYEFA